jgi:hypothetical protein
VEGLNAALEAAEAIGPRLIIYQGLKNAISTMSRLPANAGQTTIFERYIEPAFQKQGIEVMLGTDYDWDPIIIPNYMDAVGEIIEEGNQIMEIAGEEATQLEEEMEAAQAAIYILSRGTVGSFSDVIGDAFD